ncbi:hypothetical protein OQA88_2427 [Cercophora sp. LCS_1]
MSDMARLRQLLSSEQPKLFLPRDFDDDYSRTPNLDHREPDCTAGLARRDTHQLHHNYTDLDGLVSILDHFLRQNSKLFIKTEHILKLHAQNHNNFFNSEDNLVHAAENNSHRHDRPSNCRGWTDLHAFRVHLRRQLAEQRRGMGPSLGTRRWRSMGWRPTAMDHVALAKRRPSMGDATAWRCSANLGVVHTHHDLNCFEAEEECPSTCHPRRVDIDLCPDNVYRDFVVETVVQTITPAATTLCVTAPESTQVVTIPGPLLTQITLVTSTRLTYETVFVK